MNDLRSMVVSKWFDMFHVGWCLRQNMSGSKGRAAYLLRGGLRRYTRSPLHTLLAKSGHKARSVSKGEKNRLYFSLSGIEKGLHSYLIHYSNRLAESTHPRILKTSRSEILNFEDNDRLRRASLVCNRLLHSFNLISTACAT